MILILIVGLTYSRYEGRRLTHRFIADAVVPKEMVERIRLKPEEFEKEG